MPKSEKEEKGNSKRLLKVCPKMKKKKKGIASGRCSQETYLKMYFSGLTKAYVKTHSTFNRMGFWRIL